MVSAKVPAFVTELPECGELGRLLDCSGSVAGLAGPGCWFCLFGRDLFLLRFRSGQEKGSFCGGRVMGPLLLVDLGFRSPE